MAAKVAVAASSMWMNDHTPAPSATMGNWRPANRIEQGETCGFGVWGGDDSSRLGETIGDLGDESGDVQRPGTEVPAGHIVVIIPHQSTDDLCPRCIGRRPAAVPAPTPDDPDATFHGEHSQLVSQRCLANAGSSGDEE